MSAEWVHVDFYGRAPDAEAVTGVNVVEVAATLMKAFGFTHIDGLTAVRAERPSGDKAPSNLVSVWELRQEIPHGTFARDLMTWCKKMNVDLATATIVVDTEYLADGAVAFVKWEVPEGTEFAKFAGFRPR